jgi:hypothetical protein
MDVSRRRCRDRSGAGGFVARIKEILGISSCIYFILNNAAFSVARQKSASK